MQLISITPFPIFRYNRFMSKEQVFVTVQNRGLIALPSTIRHRFGLDKSGAQVEVIERDGEIILRPHVAVPVDQTWFWTERWQALEREADQAISSGRVTVFEDVDSLLADLDS